MRKYVAIMCVVFLLVGSAAFAAGKIVNTENAPKAIGPYSQAVWAGNLLFLSGQIGLVTETGKMIEGGTLAEAGQIFKNIGAILESQGLSFKDIVKVTVFGMDIKEFPEVNKLYATFFPEDPPARSFVQASALPAGALIEIEVIAYKDKFNYKKDKCEYKKDKYECPREKYEWHKKKYHCPKEELECTKDKSEHQHKKYNRKYRKK